MGIRVAIVGAHQGRVSKVLELVKEMIVNNNDYGLPIAAIDVEFLPLVATFGTYENEKGETIRYLLSVTYHGIDGKQKGTSVAQFYDDIPEKEQRSGYSDENNDSSNNNNPQHLPIAIVAIGIGIEHDNDVQSIRTFVSSMAGGLDDGIIVECIRPNPEYATMAEETRAFQQLDAEAKKQAVEKANIGPSKMAKFVLGLLNQLTRKDSIAGAHSPIPPDGGDDRTVLPDHDCQIVTTNDSFEPEGSNDAESRNHENDGMMSHNNDDMIEIYGNLRHYACRMCRIILFGESDLQDPPHVPARHSFSYRKKHPMTAATKEDNCQSLFLQTGLPWMGDISDWEGKLNCPNCHAKVGNWKWAGNQCSCGTWVTPAIQIPCSKVDVLLPLSTKE